MRVSTWTLGEKSHHLLHTTMWREIKNGVTFPWPENTNFMVESRSRLFQCGKLIVVASAERLVLYKK